MYIDDGDAEEVETEGGGDGGGAGDDLDAELAAVDDGAMQPHHIC